MSTMEKVFGIIAVLAICLIFVIILIMGILYLGRWKAKGINPNKTFPRHPKGSHLTINQQRAINVGAILSGSNNDFCDSLTTSKSIAIKTIKDILSRDWQIQSSKEAIETLERLKYGGHRQIFNYILMNATRLLPYKEGTIHLQDLYELIGFSMLDKRIIEDHPKEMALAEKNIDLIEDMLKASSFEEIKKYQPRFGDEETFLTCIQIYMHFQRQFQSYENGIKNLDVTLTDLQEGDYLGSDLSELKQIDTIAWDMGRMVNVARYCYDVGYITESKAWEYIFYAEKESESHYADWSEFGRGYIIGRALWGGKSMSFYTMMTTLKELKEKDESPWKLVSLH